MPRKKKVKTQPTDPATSSGSSEEELKDQLEQARSKEKIVLKNKKETKQVRIQKFKEKKKKTGSRSLVGCLLVVIILVLVIIGWVFTLKYKFNKTSEEPTEFSQLFGKLKNDLGDKISLFDEQMDELQELAKNPELTPEQVEDLKKKIEEEQPKALESEEQIQKEVELEESSLLPTSSWLVYYNDDYGYRLKYPQDWQKNILSAQEALSRVELNLSEKEFNIEVYERDWFDENLGQIEFVQETIGEAEVLVQDNSYHLFNEDKLYIMKFSEDINNDLKYTILNNFIFL